MYKNKKKWKIRIIAVLIICLITLGGCAGEKPPIWAEQPEVLQGPVRTMLDAVCNADYAAAGKDMHEMPELGMTCPENAVGELYYHAFVESITYELVGECYAADPGAAQKIRITCLDLNSVTEKLPQRVCTFLEQRIAEAETVSEIYDENNEYRSELIASFTMEAANAALAEDARMMTVEVPVKLICVEEQWKILPEPELLQAITGGTWTGTPDCFGTYMSGRLELVDQAVAEMDKVFWLDDADVIAPEPDPARFGTTTDPKSLQWLLDDAAELMEGQEVFFSTDIEIREDSEITYYLDDTIFCVTWQQAIDGAIYTMCEVKIAHGSQFRRYFADDTYRTRNEYYGSDMAALVNAVTAANGDYYNYKFRSYGTVVYKGQVYRANDAVDVCFVDDQGEMILLKREEIAALESVEQFVAENNIRFSIAFGPIMVRDGVNQVPTGYYVLGEIRGKYPRACLGSLGKLHYLMVTAGQTTGYRNMPTVSELADRMISFGCDKAYSLDGGQTGMIVTNDRVQSVLNYRYQRKVSDIFYFATAIPDGTGAGETATGTDVS